MPDPHEAQPERPTPATHAGTVDPRWIEVEVGAERDRFTDGSQGGSIPAVTKIGLARHLQLSIVTLFSKPAGGTAGISDCAVAVKWRTFNDAPVLGDFAILPASDCPADPAG